MQRQWVFLCDSSKTFIMQSCLFFSVKMFFDSFKSSLLAQTISCSVFNEINKKKSTFNGVFIMAHSFSWILHIPSSPLWVLHSGGPWVSASLPGHATPKLGGPLLSCLSMCVVPSVQEWERFWGSRWVPMCVYESLHWNREGGRPSFSPCWQVMPAIFLP